MSKRSSSSPSSGISPEKIPVSVSQSAAPHRHRLILCVGMCVLDIVHMCDRYPDEDSDRRCLAGYWQRGGNASNNCSVIALLGGKCEFLGMMSSSPEFSFLSADCRKRGIAIGNCPTTEREPPFSSIMLSQASGSRTIVHANSEYPILTHEHFRRIDLSAYAWIHFEARNPDETIPMLRDIHAFNARQTPATKIRISIELEKVREDYLVLAEWADVVFVGKDLARHLGWQTAKEAVYGMRDRLSSPRSGDSEHRHSYPDIVCAWGADGSSFLDHKDDHDHVPAMPPPVIVDSLGAGDTFCGTVIYAMQELGLSLRDAVEMGNMCAGYKLGYRGYDAIAKFKEQT